MTRRSRPANRFGCKPDGDVCLAHDMPLESVHGCRYAKPEGSVNKPALPPARAVATATPPPPAPSLLQFLVPADELAALRKDAARYRWLRDNTHGWSGFKNTMSLPPIYLQRPPSSVSHNALPACVDAAIDSAMRAEDSK